MSGIDPRTSAIGGGAALRVGAVVATLIALGLGARAWFDSFDAGEPDDDYACVEDERGTCPGPIPVQLQQLDDNRFDDVEANAPGEPDDNDLMVEDDTREAGHLEDAVAEPLPPAQPARLSCVVGDRAGACVEWERLSPSDRALLEDLYKRNGVRVP
jgi:hypothetical protein